ncbi:MAG: MFS transporter [Pseudomonadales bacterium]
MTNTTLKMQSISLWIGWLAMAFFVIFKTTTQTNYAILSSDIAAEFAMSLGDIGILGSIYIAGFVITTIPAGALLDFYSPRYVISLSIATIVLGAVMFSLGNSWELICLGQFIMGVGGAFGYPALGYYTRHAFGISRFTLMMGLASFAGAVFAALSQAAVANLINSYDWREITLVLAAVGGALAMLMYFILEDAKPDQLHERGSFFRTLASDCKQILKMPRLWGCAIVGGIGFSAYLAIGVVWGVQLFKEQGYAETVAGELGSWIWLGGAVGAPAIALLHSALNSYVKPMVIYSLGAAGGLLGLCLTSSGSPLLSASLMTAVGFFGSGATILGFGYAMQLCELKLAGTVTAFINFMLFVISGVLMVAPGKMIDAGLSDRLSDSLLLFPVLIIIAACSVLALYREDVFPSDASE